LEFICSLSDNAEVIGKHDVRNVQSVEEYAKVRKTGREVIGEKAEENRTERVALRKTDEGEKTFR